VGYYNLKLVESVLELNCKETVKKIKGFLKNYVKLSEANGVVLGLSGGIDSSTVAALSTLALGKNRVRALILPEEETFDLEDIDDAKLIAHKYQFSTKIIDITSSLKGIYKSIKNFDEANNTVKGNIKARIRTTYLYYFANKFNLLVCGCSDKSEIMMGYFTKWGDNASDIAPIASLYKTQVRKLANYVGIDQKIIWKPPSPKLWPGQSAEKELGLKYQTLDLVLYGLENLIEINQISKQLKIEKEIVEQIKNRYIKMNHKRKMPVIIDF